MILDGKYIIVYKKDVDMILSILYSLGYKFYRGENYNATEDITKCPKEKYYICSNNEYLDWWVYTENLLNLEYEEMSTKHLLREYKLKRILNSNE